MSDARWYDSVQGQGHEPFRVGNPAIFKSYLLRHLQWELASDYGILKQGTISKFGRAGFLIFGLLFCHVTEVGRDVSSEESTVSRVRG